MIESGVRDRKDRRGGDPEEDPKDNKEGGNERSPQKLGTCIVGTM